MDTQKRVKIKVYQNLNRLNHDDAFTFLSDVSDTFDKQDIQHWLVFGTALAAFRDGVFIPHDIDIDVAVWAKDYEQIIEIVKDSKYELVRQTKEIITIVSGKIPMDIYMFKSEGDRYECMKYHIPKWQLDTGLGTLDFCGKVFYTVNNPIAYFERLYGSDWKTPKRGVHAQQ